MTADVNLAHEQESSDSKGGKRILHNVIVQHKKRIQEWRNVKSEVIDLLMATQRLRNTWFDWVR